MGGEREKSWSPGRAASAAREARIATASYLRQAPAARSWHISRLLSAYQLHCAHTGHPRAARALLFGGMGYQPPFPSDWAAATEMVLADEARYLSQADLYILTPQMCDVVIAAAQSLTARDLELLSDDDLPSLTGLVVLPRPVIVRTVGGDLADDRAFTWRFPATVRTSPGRSRRRDLAAVRLSIYHDSHGPVRPDSFTAYAAQARSQGTPLPPLLLDSVRCWPVRYAATSRQARAVDAFASTARAAGDQARQFAAGRGHDENRVIGEYVSGARIDDRDGTFLPRFLYAFWRLCDQRIAETEHAPAGHSAQVLASRAGVPADVRVVRLRRTDSSARPGDHGSLDWQHRWVVRMHKVRQWYPSLQQHKVIYRGPYIKGPSDKPLLGGDIVRALVR